MSVALLVNTSVSALDTNLSTTNTNIPPVAPLIVTSFLVSDNMQNINILEIYNSGKTPIDLSEWNIVGVVTEDNTYNLGFSGDAGYILPNTHVVLADVNTPTTPKATYEITGWLGTPPTSPITEIDIVNDAHRPSIAPMKSSFDGSLRMRKYNQASYSDATSPFDEPWRDNLFDDGLYNPPASSDGLEIVEVYPYADDCSPLDTDIFCRDYVKITNTSGSPISLDGFVLRTSSSSVSRTSSNTINLGGEIAPGKFVTISTTDNGNPLQLTNSGGYVWLEDAWGLVKYPSSLAQYEGASAAMRGQAYALDSGGVWRWTTSPSPDSINKIHINLSAGCSSGSVLNPVTGRCNKIAMASTLTPCKAGQERNPATNRCRSVLGASTQLKPCAANQERNPETNRCRKVAIDSVPAAEFAVKKAKQTGSDFVGYWALGVIAIIAAGYGVWEWRGEIGRGFGALITRIRR